MKSIISLVLVAVVAALAVAQDRETFERQGSQSTIQEDCDTIVPNWPPLGTINDNYWGYPPIKRKTISVSSKKKTGSGTTGAGKVDDKIYRDRMKEGGFLTESEQAQLEFTREIEKARSEGRQNGYDAGYKAGKAENEQPTEPESRPNVIAREGVAVGWVWFLVILAAIVGFSGGIGYLYYLKGYRKQYLKMASPTSETPANAGETRVDHEHEHEES